MNPTLRDSEILRLLMASSAERYQDFLARVVADQQFWSLWDQSGWVLAGHGAGPVFPVWPNERFARLCASGHWRGCQPRAISLAAWRERWGPGLLRDGRRAAVFPTAERAGRIIAADALGRDLVQAAGESSPGEPRARRGAGQQGTNARPPRTDSLDRQGGWHEGQQEQTTSSSSGGTGLRCRCRSPAGRAGCAGCSSSFAS